MVLSVASVAMASQAPTATITKADGVTGNASITLNIPADIVAQAVTNTYRIYKVFDAVSDGTSSNISYTSRQGDTLPTGFVLDGQGNIHHGTKDAQTGAITENTATALTAEEITSIQNYVRDADLIATVVVPAGVASFTVSDIPYGYYFIDTTTGTVVTVDSTNPTVTVDDKNTAPSLDKKITGGTDDTIDAAGKAAIAKVGSTVEYTGTITVGKGMKNYTYHDKMTSGLQFIPSTLVVTGQKSATDTTAVTVDYTLLTTPENDDTFTVDFADGLAEGTVIKLVYSAQVTNAALTVNYEKNTAYLDYGRNPGENKTPESETKVYAAKITVIKQDGSNQPLAGAKFKLSKSANEWYKLDTVDGKPVVTWVAKDSAPEIEAVAVYGDAQDPTKVTSYEAVFQGLPAGTYTLEETTVPQGYNKAADKTFTIKPATSTDSDVFTVTNLEQTATVINNAGNELPSTGGIGTTIFYVIGAVLVLGAAAVIIARRKAEQN